MIALEDLATNEVFAVNPNELGQAFHEEVPVPKLSSVEQFYQDVHDITERREKRRLDRELKRAQGAASASENTSGSYRSGGDGASSAPDFCSAARAKLAAARNLVITSVCFFVCFSVGTACYVTLEFRSSFCFAPDLQCARRHRSFCEYQARRKSVQVRT